MNQEIYHSTDKFHTIYMTVVWDGLATIGLALPLFPQFSSIIHFHGILMWIVTAMSLGGIVPEIIVTGFVPGGIATLHYTCGLIVLFEVVFICLLGRLLRIKKESPTASPNTVYIITRIHAILGILLYLTAQLAVMSKWYILDMNVFIGLLTYQIIFLLVRTIYFLFPPTLRAKAKDFQTDKREIQTIRRIKNKKDMLIYSNNYFVFADYVYSLSEILHSHPGGFQIIEGIRGREVDRFLYGGQPLERLADEHKRLEHSVWALNLAGPPLAKFDRYNPYPGMSDFNQCQVASLRQLNRGSSVYLVELRGKGGQFQYAGFQSISQLGQYFTLSINGAKTRLYTSVNCMSATNRWLMGEISEEMRGNFGDDFQKKDEVELMDYTESATTGSRSMEKGPVDCALPLLIKKYDDGFFTSEFISPDFKGTIQVSRSLGAGLALQEKKPGKIILMAGGTGIYPFIDTIDILYKKALVDANHAKKEKILSLNPAVGDPWLNEFTFEVAASFQNPTDIHPMTLFQLSELCDLLPGRFVCSLKVSHPGNDFPKKYPGIRLTSERFEGFLNKQLSSEEKIDGISQMYMCGPTRMTGSILKAFDQYSISTEKYTII